MKLRLFAFIFLVFAAACEAAYEPAVILKKNTVEISKDRIYLGDVADFSGVDASAAEDLSTTYIKRAALPGYSVKVTRINVENQVRKEFRAIKIAGPESVEVYTAKAVVSRERLLETARDYILLNMPWQKEDVEIIPAKNRGDIEVIKGTVLLKVREDNKLDFKGSLIVPVEVIVDGKFYKIEPVSLLVKVKANCLVAAENIRVREPLEGKAAVEKRDVTYFPGDLMTDLSKTAGKSAKRAIMKGTILAPGMFESAPFFRRGGLVSVVVKIRNITVETAGTALGDGREGSRVKVKLETGKLVEGVVSGDGKVIIEK